MAIPQLHWPADLFSETSTLACDTSAPAVVEIASSSELSLWLVMQGLWRVNAAWAEDAQD